ncbi:MAG: alpha-glucan family phosphorylase [Bacteroidetes bacterium]|nr:alpha-glucan family phosphorylase [Bacteroidota bacterium]MCL1968394.1 alpha-glucan family phosphorylase [Bacteroidota bacterium]
MKQADYVFETSWEICNKVGGIYTVLSTKAFTAVQNYGDNYICIGPELSIEDNSDFIEDPSLFRNWREIAQSEGLRIRAGRWNISGAPIVFLVDFTPFFEKKNDILTQFWLKYQLDSISGQWDYIEPALFGYAAARVIESFYNYYCYATDKIIAHFHEWMTGTGILYLEEDVPQIATVFTTHATVLGRCIAGNRLPLYGMMEDYNDQEFAQRFNVQSKYSLELLSAKYADGFTTVSQITNRECAAFLKKPADVITINGFENNFVPNGEEYTEKRTIARKKLKEVTQALIGQEIAENTLFVVNSGRYEFRNKGIDLFINGLAKLKEQCTNRPVVAYILVPAGTSGQRHELIEKIESTGALSATPPTPVLFDYCTHPLHNPDNDSIVTRLKNSNLDNSPLTQVKVVFVPVYLDGKDGIFNLPYYDLLIGFDLSVFPSYYEPWGYTPLESIAFGIPTTTTSLAGFGKWVMDNFGNQKSAWVIQRDDDNDNDVSNEIADAIFYYANLKEDEKEKHNASAIEIAQKALWGNLYDNYLKTYDTALTKSALRYDKYKHKVSRIGIQVAKMKSSDPHWSHITVKTKLPENLNKLEELAHNLWWSWNYEARELFEEIAGADMWKKYHENPTHILQILPLPRMQEVSTNKHYIKKLDKVFDDFQSYINVKKPVEKAKIAYFSMEYGISNELKIFSGGLGMLAGDYLKEASDCNVNMIGVGLLYRYGYFKQQISPNGDQVSLYPSQSFSKLPILPIKDENGEFKMITIALPGRTLYARIWRVEVGRIPLYLLDTDFDLNQPQDTHITHTLYGGDIENRLKQEVLLGVGGFRMLKMLGENPELYHLNEGHAAFLTLERINQYRRDYNMAFPTAVELVRASSLYTTHTPVPAGHDVFSEDLMRIYFANYPARFNIPWEAFMALGRKHIDNVNDKFSMSILACKLSQEINGVSKIHGRVSREMFAELYDGHFANELHIDFVTNGVHYPTWAHKKWQNFHKEILGNDFLADQSNPEVWKKIKYADNATLWNIKNELRAELLEEVKQLLEVQMMTRNESPELILNTLKSIKNDTFTIGFARRFATYKRAHLLFTNEERLAQIVNHPEHPVQFLFAGKAHPNDQAGQDLIKKIIAFSRLPQFIGKIIFLENYDMILAKKLVSGCDVWLNTPTRPLEASGTSGEKAIMNGVLNFSVLDGWWAEGYVPEGGWAIDDEITYKDNGLQDQLDATVLYATIEENIVKAFYTRNEENVPEIWTNMMKENFAKISPHFTMKRQLEDYYNKFYNKLEQRTKMLTQDNEKNLYTLLRWKEKMLANWEDIKVVNVNLDGGSDKTFYLGESATLTVAIHLGTLVPEDVKVEICFIQNNNGNEELFYKELFHFVIQENGITHYECEIIPNYSGSWKCGVRIQPANPMLPHDMDFNLVKWG